MKVKYFTTHPTNISDVNHSSNVKLPKDKLPISTSSVKSFDTVNVSKDHQLIEDAKQELSTLPDFDMDKVASLRKSLKDGSFDLNLDKITDAILSQHNF